MNMLDKFVILKLMLPTQFGKIVKNLVIKNKSYFLKLNKH